MDPSRTIHAWTKRKEADICKKLCAFFFFLLGQCLAVLSNRVEMIVHTYQMKLFNVPEQEVKSKFGKNIKLYVDPLCAIPIYNNHMEHPVNHGLDEKFGSVVYRCDNFKQ